MKQVGNTEVSRGPRRNKRRFHGHGIRMLRATTLQRLLDCVDGTLRDWKYYEFRDWNIAWNAREA